MGEERRSLSLAWLRFDACPCFVYLIHAASSGSSLIARIMLLYNTRRWDGKASNRLVVAGTSLKYSVDKSPARKSQNARKSFARTLLNRPVRCFGTCKVMAYSLSWPILRGCKRRRKLYSVLCRQGKELDLKSPVSCQFPSWFAFLRLAM
jgi:hypothetical protein